MRKVIYIYTFLLVGLVSFLYYAHADDLPKRFPFNKKGALKEWEEKIFKNRVLYTVELNHRESGHLSAVSKQACSGLFFKMRFNVKRYPMISWYWKVIDFPQKDVADQSDNGWVEKDDYAARVYVIFPTLSFNRTKTLEYIWDEQLPEGTIMTSPYLPNIKIMVLESGKKNKGRWVFEERNIYADYQQAFGRTAPTFAGAIALMTDTDNTLSTAEALYKDIKVGYKDEAKK